MPSMSGRVLHGEALPVKEKSKKQGGHEELLFLRTHHPGRGGVKISPGGERCPQHAEVTKGSLPE